MFPKPVHKKMRTNAQKITLQDRRVCWVCGTTLFLECHHAFGGPNRKWSELYGLKAYFCHTHHTGDPGIHFNPDLRLKFQQHAQREFEKVYGHELFMQIFGRNYL